MPLTIHRWSWLMTHLGTVSIFLLSDLMWVTSVTATELLILPSRQTGNLMAGKVSTILMEITLPGKKAQSLQPTHTQGPWQLEPIVLSPKSLEREWAVTRAQAKGPFQSSQGQLDVPLSLGAFQAGSTGSSDMRRQQSCPSEGELPTQPQSLGRRFRLPSWIRSCPGPLQLCPCVRKPHGTVLSETENGYLTHTTGQGYAMRVLPIISLNKTYSANTESQPLH